MSEDEIGLVIAGAGGGLVGALRAAEHGLDVVVVEISEHYRRGNNTSMSTAMIPGAGSRYQAERRIPDSPEAFVADMVAKTKGAVDRRLATALAAVSGRLVEWLADRVELPLELVTDFQYPGHSYHRMHTVPGRHGTVLLDQLARKARREDLIDLLVPARLVEVQTDERGVSGVVVERPDGALDELPTRNLLLATNGFGADRDLVARHIPEIAAATYHGSEFSRGDALRIGQVLGADTGFLDAYQGHAALAAKGATLVGWATVMHGGILVDATGARFGDETCGYSEYAAMLATRPGANGWLIFDARIEELCRSFTDFQQTLESGAVLSAEDLDDLAQLLGVPADALGTELSRSEAAAKRTEPDPWGRTDFEAPLAAPYRAVRVVPALFHTQGGLVVDEHARVLKPDGSIVPGLFAAGGAAIGISGHGASGYLAGNGLLPALGLPFLAAEHLAASRLSQW